MLTTTTPSPNGRSSSAEIPVAPSPRIADRLPQSTRRQRPALAALAIMLVIGCAAISASLVLASGKTISVLTVTHRVPMGQVVTAGDLGTADVAGSGLTAVRAAARGRVVGLVAAVDLLPGTLLTAAMVTRDPVPARGQAVVGLSLKAGLLPDAELRAGTSVMLVRLPTSAAAVADGQSANAVLVPRARVLSVSSDRTTGSRLVSLLVDQSVAAEVARAAAAGTVSVVVIGPGT